MTEPIWVNYHKHSSLSNRYTKDSPLVPMDYWLELKARYGETPCIYTTVEHGWAGNYFKQYDDLEKFNKKNDTNIKFVFGCEAYWVKNRHENDRSNCHIILLARNDKGRRAINKIVSIANKDGYYARPRIDLELIDMLPPDDVFITTACIAFWNKYDDIEEIVKNLSSKFPHFYLEVQPHHTDSQVEINRRIVELSYKYNIPIIAGCDSHVITESQMEDRDELLKSGGIRYEDEDGWFMDYPSYDILFDRFRKQGVLTDEQIKAAIDQTNVIFDFEDIILDRSLKVPVVKSLRDKTQEERNKIFEKILQDEWRKQRDDINQDKLAQYQQEIQHDIKEIESCNMADYFILSYEIMKLGQEKYGGILTPSGRGSAVSMYLNKLLRLTKVDKVNSPVLMYSERFLTKERVIDSHTPPDIDNNVSTREPFIQAQKELVGDLGTYDLLALGTLKFKAAWKMYARANNVDPDTANEVSKQIDKYEKAKKYAEENEVVDIKQYIDPKYQELVDGCQKYLGIYDTAKGHPCFVENELIMTSNGYKRIKDIVVGDGVLSDDGKYHRVKELFTTPNVNDIYELISYGSPAIQVTGNHPFYAKKRRGTPTWKTVNNLERGDLIAVPINQYNKLPDLGFVDSSNLDFWWCIGRYFGDGWRSHTIRKSGRKTGQKIKNVIICCNKNNDETNEILSHASWCLIRVTEEATTNKIYFKNKELYNWLEEFGDYAIGKHLTGTILNLPVEQLRSFLSGYFSADGHFDKITNEQTFSTINKELALGIVACINKAYNRPCSLIKSRNDRVETIQGRQVNSHAQYRGEFHYEARKQDQAFYEDGMIWVPYRKKKKLEEIQTVYNFEVEDTHNYTVNNLLVHNCGCLCHEGDIESEIGVSLCKSEATGKEVLVANIESGTIDAFGYLKQDYLIVDSIGLTYDIYKEAGLEPFTVNQLLDKIRYDEATWKIYEDGYTQCVNQCEQLKSTQKVMRYKPKNISELTQFVAAIRPSFQSMYHTFESRQHFDYGIKALDDLLQDEYCSSSFILYQESLMKVLGFAGFPMSETYTIIKAISKKKDYIIKDARPKFITNFAKAILDTGETTDEDKAHELAEEVWTIVENSAAYGFNCVSGDTVIKKPSSNGSYIPTISEMYRIRHDAKYARETGHKSLHDKYMREGYGYGLSMKNGRIYKNRIVEIYKQPEAETYLITTRMGRTIKATANHKFPTEDGIKMVSELTVGDKLYAIGKYSYNENGIETVIDEIISIEYNGVETVYDVEMSGDVEHNFVTSEGLVTCNSAHAYCMAIDSVTIAYLKAHYPLEFYKCVLQRFTDKGEKDKVALIKQEMLKRGFKLKDIQFGDDNRQFNIDRENNCIIQTMVSIKDMPKSAPQALYELGQKGIKTRSQLYQGLIDDNRINAKAIDILFKLDYFKAFANPNRLLAEFEVYKKYINSKELSKSSFDDDTIQVVRECCGKETEKKFKEIDNKKLIGALIKKMQIKQADIIQKIKWQSEFLGYCTLTNPGQNINDWVVLNVDVNAYGTAFLSLYNICYGAEKTYKVDKKWWGKCSCKQGDAIRALLCEKPKYKKGPDGKPVKTGEMETVIKCFEIIGD